MPNEFKGDFPELPFVMRGDKPIMLTAPGSNVTPSSMPEDIVSIPAVEPEPVPELPSRKEILSAAKEVAREQARQAAEAASIQQEVAEEVENEREEEEASDSVFGVSSEDIMGGDEDDLDDVFDPSDEDDEEDDIDEAVDSDVEDVLEVNPEDVTGFKRDSQSRRSLTRRSQRPNYPTNPMIRGML